jgi:hypothetical protein
VKLTTVTFANRRHYAHPENNRTLCGRPEVVTQAEGDVECGRCIQILQHVDTSRGRQ